MAISGSKKNVEPASQQVRTYLATLPAEARAAVADATATFDRVGPDGQRFGAEDVHRTELASLHGEFATVRTSPELLETSQALR